MCRKAIIWGCLILLPLALSAGVWAQWANPRTGPHPAPPAPVYFLAEVEKEIFRLTNEQRRSRALPPLAWDETCGAAARAHTGDMLQRRYFSHVTPEGYSLKDRLLQANGGAPTRAGENIWSGSGMNYTDSRWLAGTIVAGWMNSPGHRAQILEPRYTCLGVGAAVLGRELRATQDFLQQ